jgi:hypothetical protein
MTIMHLVIVEAIARFLEPVLVNAPHANMTTGARSKRRNSQPGRSN